MTEQPKRQQIRLEIPANLQAAYANLAVIMHNQSEFFVDFAQRLPGLNKTRVHTRIALSPMHAKLLYRALGENLEQYESKHGAIEVPQSLADQLFGGLRPSSSEEGDDDNG
jgi:hypothetical protein